MSCFFRFHIFEATFIDLDNLFILDRLNAKHSGSPVSAQGLPSIIWATPGAQVNILAIPIDGISGDQSI